MSSLQMFAIMALIVALAIATEFDPDYLYVDEDVGNTEDINPLDETVHVRWKRDITDSGWNLPGGGLLRKAKKLMDQYKNLPPNLREGIQKGDFSNVTEKDIQNVNVTVLEYIPSKVFEKINSSLLTIFIDKFVQFNRPNALGRLVEATGDKLDTTFLLNKIHSNGGIKDSNEGATNVLLYSALSKVGDKGGLNTEVVRRLVRENLLDYVSDEQLMKVKDASVAKTLLKSLTQRFQKSESRNDVDSKALISELVGTGYGAPKDWTPDAFKHVESNINVLPAAVLKDINPEIVTKSIKQLSESKFENPLQVKSISDNYFQSNPIPKNQESGYGDVRFLEQVTTQLGKLSAFIPPGITKNSNILSTIISSCEELDLPAPLKAIVGFFEGKLGGNKKVSDLKAKDFQTIPSSVLKNSPPNIIKAAMADKNSISKDVLEDIGKSSSVEEEGKTQNSFFKGMLSQLAVYAIQAFSAQGGNIDFSKLPGVFLGALGIKGIDKLMGNDIELATTNLKDSPDALDNILKSLLLKKLKDNRSPEDINIPPELIDLTPRKKSELIRPDILDGLPSDSEFRLAFGHSKSNITAYDLKKSPHLVGTLTPKQVADISLEEIPAVLAIVRTSRDGPQTQTLKALHTRFVEYIRLKTDDYETKDDKKLLKHITAAEISKLPATVLAYFIDSKHRTKLPDAVRKEIMIAMGELSTKDHASIPRKTREEIILQGLDALDKTLGPDKSYTVVELAAIGHGIVDLPVDKIKRLNPVAAELSLEVIHGVGNDRLKQRACLTPEQRHAWRDQIILNYGAPETWDPATVSTICCSLELLTEDDLIKVTKDGIVTCKCASDMTPPSHLVELKKSLDTACKYDLGKSYNSARNTFEKIKSERSLDIEDLESQIIRHGRTTRDTHTHNENKDNQLLNCYALRLTGSAAAFDSKTLSSLQSKEINNCLYELGVDKLSHDKAKILWKKLVESWNNSVESIPHENLRLANNILNGISELDIVKLNFSEPDVLAAFGRPLGLSKNILKKMAAHFQATHLKYPLRRFTSRDLIFSRNILCGFEKEELATINPNNFKEALPVLRNIEPCEQSRLTAMASLLITPAVFGESSKWDAADVRGIGIFLKGLSIADAKKIPAEAFLGVTPTVAQALTSDTLKELSPEQLGHIPRFSAQAMSSEQVSSLTSEGRESLESIIRGPLITSNSVNLQSISVLIATIVFITTIFINQSF